MRFFILTKRKIVVLLLCITIGIVSCVIGVNTATKAITASTEQRIIPIYNVDRKDKVCSISFDAAWGNEQTPTLLKILKKYNIKSTFFLVGNWVKKYPNSVKAIAKAGHDIGNHSNTHNHLTQLNTEAIAKDIQSCNNKVKVLTHKEPVLFRAPYGDYNNNVVSTVMSKNMYCVQWNIDSLDWKNPTAEQIVQNCVAQLEPGSIILMHNGATNTPEALPKVIEAIQSKGYKILPISKLVLKGKYHTDVQGKMISD